MTASTFAPRFEVRVSGVALAADLADSVLSLVVETDLDLAGSFGIVVRNRDNALLDSALIDLGKTVEVHLGYGNDLEPAFLGEIASVEPVFPQDGPSTIRITGYDKSYRMRRAQPAPTTYRFMNDSVIAARIALENRLVPVIDPTPGLPDEIVQAESDMAFLKSRAEQYFFDVYVDWDRLHFQLPRPQFAAHVLEWGKNLSSFSPRISAAGMAGLQVVRGYNQELAQTIHATALAADFDLDDLVERLGGSALDLLTSLARRGLRKQPVDSPLKAAVLARALLASLLEGMYEGTGSCIGIPELKAGRYVEVRGVGRRFGGTYRLRKVTHRIDGSGFRTDFSITQRGHTSLLGLLRKKVTEEPSPTLPERITGVVVGTVVANHEFGSVPPEVPLGRVQVCLPGLSEDFVTGWAPCARPMAGSDVGFWALPEEGEQVLVAFEQGDLSKPYVLGSLWSVEQRPPEDNLDGRNSRRVIRTKAGHTMTFDDTGGLGALTIEDGAGSSITLDSRDRSMTISAANDLTIKAAGQISLQAAGGTTAITMTAQNVDVT
jgi:phage protein D/phage baseplate assembly protein gpV